MLTLHDAHMDLVSHRFISYFEPEQATALCQLALIEDFEDRGIIFEESEVPDFLYLVLVGQVEFRKRTGPDKYQTVARALPDDFFGEFGVLDGQPRSAQALAAGHTTLAKIPRESLMEILQSSKGGVVLNLFRYIIQHLRSTTTQYVNQLVYKEKMVLVGEMVNTMIHDFKSPFTGILLASSMLKDIHVDEETREWCDLIQTQVNRMLGMADEVLEFASGNSVLKKKPVNLAIALKRFEKLNQIYFQNYNVHFKVIAGDVIVHCDENKLIRVLQNLVVNAVESFSEQGGQVEITISTDAEWVTLSIFDNGPGIPAEIRERLFEPFITYGKQRGTGLGTAIAKSIINAHNGEIWFDSQCPQGTTFYIRLPLSGDPVEMAIK